MKIELKIHKYHTQTHTQTYRHTDRVTSWAPSRSQNHFKDYHHRVGDPLVDVCDADHLLHPVARPLLVESLALSLHCAAERLLLGVELLKAGAEAGEGNTVVVHHRLTALEHALVR